MIERIVSGGQTGADRAALDFAISRGIPHSGWCPKGRKAEDGALDARYNLKETPSANYLQRTEWNARDSDGTVIFSLAPVLTGGSLKTQVFTTKHKKPCATFTRGCLTPRRHCAGLSKPTASNLSMSPGHAAARSRASMILF